MSNIIELRPAITACDRCGGGIADGAEAMTVSVQHEKWHGGPAHASVEVIRADSALVFCMPCAKYFNFQRVAVARKKNELDIETEKRHEEALIEDARPEVAKVLFLKPEEVSVEQIRGWLLEQEYLWILAEENRDCAAKALGYKPSELSQGQIIEWVDANPDLKSQFI